MKKEFEPTPEEMEKSGLIYCRNCMRPRKDHYKGLCRECYILLNPKNTEGLFR